MLEIRNLTKIYEDGTLAVDNVSFTVPDGEFMIVIGLSGSGKSTLLRCINRLIDPTEGEIIWDGVDLAKLEGEELRKAHIKTVETCHCDDQYLNWKIGLCQDMAHHASSVFKNGP